jgi:glycerol-3-phosphate acyltransferase PlsX
MGSYYARRALGIEEPRVGLLNNGAEDSKGDPLHKEAYALLKQADERGTIKFVGNVEGRDAMLGACDVLVADGFSGNIFLKGVEGTGLFMGALMKRMFQKNLRTKLGYVLCKKDVKEMMGTLDYKKVGGTMLLGISKPVIKAHGSSDAEALVSAVRQAVEAVNSGICQDIRDNIDLMTLPKESESNA